MKQKIITKAIADAIQRTPYGTTDGQKGNAKVIAKLFYPRGSNAFLIVEGGHNPGETWDGDKVFGWCKLDGNEYELGSFSIRELLTTKVKIAWTYGTCELGIERDICVDVKKKTVLEVMGSEAPAWLTEKDDADATKNPEPTEPVATAAEPVETPAPEKPKRARKSRPTRATKADKAEIHPVSESMAAAVGITYGKWEPEKWKDMKDLNDHNGVRVAICTWARDNATSEGDEFSLLLGDFLYVQQAGEAGMTPELMDFRAELSGELAERVTRVFGGDWWRWCNECL